MTLPNTSTTLRLAHEDGSAIRALVVDDEVALAEAIAHALVTEGWEIMTANRGRDALKAFEEFRPDVVLLDIMMPDLDGRQVLDRLRRDGATTPVLFLTAKDALRDRIDGLAAGGDDYVTKPFSIDEVVARSRGLVRRALGSAIPSPTTLSLGDLELDEETRLVTRGGEQIVLTATEFKVLRFFLRNPRRVLSKGELLENVWGYDFGTGSTVLEMYISYLRKKVDAGRDPMIHTIRGAGYIIKSAA
jgi:two-component system OmpR family response regulator